MEKECKENDLDYFRSIPWCTRTIEDPNFECAPTLSREPKASTEDAFFAEVLRTPHTVSKCLSLYKKPHNPTAKIEEVRTYLQLGYQLSGHPYVLHGGVTCVILDEICGLLLTHEKHLAGGSAGLPTVTASLNVTFLRQIQVPGVVVAIARFKETLGRKNYIEATIEDEHGSILAKADALFIAVNALGQGKL